MRTRIFENTSMVTFLNKSLSSKNLDIESLIDKSIKAQKQLNIPESEVTIVLDSNKKLKELKIVRHKKPVRHASQVFLI